MRLVQCNDTAVMEDRDTARVTTRFSELAIRRIIRDRPGHDPSRICWHPYWRAPYGQVLLMVLDTSRPDQTHHWRISGPYIVFGIQVQHPKTESRP